MRQRQRFFPVFVIFLLVSLLSLLIFRTPIGNVVAGVIEILASPLQSITHTAIIVAPAEDMNKELKTLREENRKLIVALAQEKETEKENQALKDQFATSIVPPKELLPAAVIGSRTSDIASVEPSEITIDKGKNQGVIEGMAVVYKDILIGQVVRASENRSVVRLPIHSESSIPAKTAETNALGIVKGRMKGFCLITSFYPIR